MTARCSLETRPVVGAGDEWCRALALPGLGHRVRWGARGWWFRDGPFETLASLAPQDERCSLLHQIRWLRSRGTRRLETTVRPLRRQLVEPGGEPLGQAAGVGEDDGGGVLLDQVEHALLDVRPQRPRPGAVLAFLAELGHVLDRDHDLEVPLLLRGGRDHLDRCGATQEAGHLVDRADRRREADPLRRLVEELVEALEGDGQVGAALGAGDRVHLVDDHRLHPAQGLAGLGGEHQEQRLGGGDQDVGRRRLDPATLLGSGVAGAQADPDLGHLGAETLRGLPDADQGRAQVALDVDGEGLERRDVEHPAAQLLLGHRLGGEPVDRPEERRQASCRTRWERPPARADRPRSRPRPRSAQASAPRRRRRTTPAWPD